MAHPLIEKIRKIKAQLLNDGSKEIAEGHIETLIAAEEMEVLLRNTAFTKILEKMKTDMTVRLRVLVEKDPELAAMKRMFIRTIGLRGASARIEETLSAFIEDAE